MAYIVVLMMVYYGRWATSTTINDVSSTMFRLQSVGSFGSVMCGVYLLFLAGMDQFGPTVSSCYRNLSDFYAEQKEWEVYMALMVCTLWGTSIAYMILDPHYVGVCLSTFLHRIISTWHP